MFKVLEGGTQPTRGTEFSAGVDLYAREDVVIGAGETKIVPLGVKIDLDFIKKTIYDTSSYPYKHFKKDDKNAMLSDFLKKHVLKLYIRSSLSAKHGLVIGNGTGIVDMDFSDEIGIIIHKPFPAITDGPYSEIDGKTLYEPYFVKKGDRVAQITLEEHKGYLFGIESEEKRDGGYGSTGK